MRHTCSAIDTVYHFDWLVWPTLHYNVQHSAAQHQILFYTYIIPFSPTWDFYNSFYAGKFYIIHWFYIRVSKFQLRILFLFLVRFEPKDVHNLLLFSIAHGNVKMFLFPSDFKNELLRPPRGLGFLFQKFPLRRHFYFIFYKIVHCSAINITREYITLCYILPDIT